MDGDVERDRERGVDGRRVRWREGEGGGGIKTDGNRERLGE